MNDFYSLSEQLIWGLEVTVMGMVVVFIALVLVSGSLGIFRAIGNSKKKMKHLPKQNKNIAPTATPMQDDGISPEIIAAISAAVAVVLDSRYQVKRIRYQKVERNHPWKLQGIASIMNSHSFPRK